MSQGTRRDVIAAQHQYERARGQWLVHSRVLRACLARNREAWVVAGGFASGLLTGLMSASPVRGTVSLVAGSISFALRSPLVAQLRNWVKADQGEASAAAHRTARPT